MRVGKVSSTGASTKGMVPIDFGGRDFLVDFEGGKSMQTIKGKTVVEDAGTEVLLITGGKLVVRTSAADKHEASRISREKDWLAWQTQHAQTKERLAACHSPLFG